MRESKKKWLDFAVLLLTMETNNARVATSKQFHIVVKGVKPKIKVKLSKKISVLRKLLTDIKTKCRNRDLLFLLKNQFFRCNSFDIDNHRLLNITTNGCWTGGSCYATIILYGP